MKINKKNDNDRNLMLGVYVSIKKNYLTGRNISICTIDLSSPLIKQKLEMRAKYVLWTKLSSPPFPTLIIVVILIAILVHHMRQYRLVTQLFVLGHSQLSLISPT